MGGGHGDAHLPEKRFTTLPPADRSRRDAPSFEADSQLASVVSCAVLEPWHTLKPPCPGRGQMAPEEERRGNTYRGGGPASFLGVLGSGDLCPYFVPSLCDPDETPSFLSLSFFRRRLFLRDYNRNPSFDRTFPAK